MAYDHNSDVTEAGQLGGRHSISRSASAANLEDVFDDPAHGEVGRDRLGVHFAWEGVLLLGAIGLGYLLFANYREAVTGEQLKGLLVAISALGLLALAASISLRVGAPNLSIGLVAVASALFYAEKSANGLVAGALWPVLFALGLGLVMALIVVGFQVPGWAGTLIGALIVVAWIEYRYQADVEVGGGFEPSERAYYLIGGFVLLSVVGGLLALIKGVRRGVGRFRPISDPALRRGGLAATVTSLGIIAATVLASLAGVIMAAASRSAGDEISADPSAGFALTALAIGIALVGGTSAFGRRGGVFGTVLATVLAALISEYGVRADWQISPWVLAAGALLAGLVVTRLVETFGRPLSLEEGPDDWSDVGIGTGMATTASWSTPVAPDAWSGLSAQPTSPAATTTTQWGAETDRWR
jgi:ribose/xylose/arabinose/galactoside ABC-type transport system permease subunit